MSNRKDEPMIIKVTVSGVELPVELFTTSDENEVHNVRVSEALELAEEAESPDFMISTASSVY